MKAIKLFCKKKKNGPPKLIPIRAGASGHGGNQAGPRGPRGPRLPHRLPTQDPPSSDRLSELVTWDLLTGNRLITSPRWSFSKRLPREGGWGNLACLRVYFQSDSCRA